MNDIKSYLASQFKMKYMGEVDTILGVKVKKYRGGYALCQSHYIDKVISKFNHLGIKEVNTPLDASSKLVENLGRGEGETWTGAGYAGFKR